MRQVASKLGDGWIPSFLTPEEYKNGMDEIINLAERLGKRRSKFTFAYDTGIILAESRKQGLKTYSGFHFASGGVLLLAPEETMVIGSPEECVEQLQKYVNLGIDMIILQVHHVDRFEEKISLIRDEIITQIDVSKQKRRRKDT